MSVASKVKSIISSALFRRVELGILFVLLALLFVRRIDYVQFFADESYWIAYDRYFDVLAAGDFSPAAWSDVNQLSDQPMLTVYLIGLSRYSAGYRAEDINTTWNYRADEQTNITEGNMPSAGLLWWSRLPMALLAALTGMLVFWLVSQSFNRLAGYIWLFEYIVSYYITATLCKAMAESPLLASVSLVGVCGFFALHEWHNASTFQPASIKHLWTSFLWLFLMGVCCGLAAASKINGVVAIGGGFILIVWATLKYGAIFPRVTRILSASIASAALIFGAAVTFSLLHPFLYYDTFNHASLFFTSRLNTMGHQQERFAGDQIDDFSERIQVVPDMLFQELAVVQFNGSFWLNIAVCGFGFLVALKQLFQQPTSLRARAGLSLLVLAVTVAVPPLFTPLNWPRYYILPVVFAMLFAALGLAQLIEIVYAVLRRQVAVRRPAQPYSTP